jgi:hypothetical protein
MKKMTLKQVLLLFDYYKKRREENMKELASIISLSVSAAFGSKEAFKALNKWIGSDKGSAEEI